MNEQMNPHEAALAILAEAEQKGQRLAFDPTLVVLADLRIITELRDKHENNTRIS